MRRDSPSSGPAPFPTTRFSILEAARDDDPERRREALDALIAVYWRPCYGHLRRRWRLEPADAEDVTQEFFARGVERGFVEGYDPSRARFRTFLRVCLDRFAANAARAERRLKRAPGAVLSLDFAEAEASLASDAGDDPDTWFDREWVRSLFTISVDALRERVRGTPHEMRFRVFERFDLASPDGAGRPSYRQLAEELCVPVTQVTNHLAWARRELRKLVLERVRLLSATDAEYRAEAAELFGEDGRATL